MTQDLYNNLKVAKALTPVATTGTGNGTTVDTKGYQSIMFAVNIGAVSAADVSNYLTFSIEESDTDFSGAAVTDTNRIQGTLLVINDTALANTVAKFGLTQLQKRYVRLVVTETGTFSAIVGAIAILGSPMHAPAA